MKLVCISDTHNLHHDLKIPDGDVLVHAGDITVHGKFENFAKFNGYHPPLNEIDPSTLVQKGIVPENLENSVLTN